MTNNSTPSVSILRRARQPTSPINSAITKIRSQFGETPEDKLCFAVVEQAIKDLKIKEWKKKATEYLNKDKIEHAEICGVDSGWIRLVLRKSKLL